MKRMSIGFLLCASAVVLYASEPDYKAIAEKCIANNSISSDKQCRVPAVVREIAERASCDSASRAAVERYIRESSSLRDNSSSSREKSSGEKKSSGNKK